MLSTPKHAAYRGWRSQGKFLEPDLLTVFQRSREAPTVGNDTLSSEGMPKGVDRPTAPATLPERATRLLLRMLANAGTIHTTLNIEP